MKSLRNIEKNIINNYVIQESENNWLNVMMKMMNQLMDETKIKT